MWGLSTEAAGRLRGFIVSATDGMVRGAACERAETGMEGDGSEGARGLTTRMLP